LVIFLFLCPIFLFLIDLEISPNSARNKQAKPKRKKKREKRSEIIHLACALEPLHLIREFLGIVLRNSFFFID